MAVPPADVPSVMAVPTCPGGVCTTSAGGRADLAAHRLGAVAAAMMQDPHHL